MALLDGDTLQVKIYCSKGEQVAINVRHYQVASTVGALVTELNVANTLAALLAPRYKAFFSPRARFEGVGVQRIAPAIPGVEFISTSGAGAGVLPGDDLPGQVAGLISLRTPLAGRSRRGRLYVPFMNEDHCGPTGIPGGVSSALLGNLAVDLQTAQAVVNGASSNLVVPVIRSKKLGTSILITNTIVPLRFATQRRRGSFGAPNKIQF